MRNSEPRPSAMNEGFVPVGCRFRSWAVDIMKDCGIEHYSVVLGDRWECFWNAKFIMVDNDSLDGYCENMSTIKLLRLNGIYENRMSQFKVSFLHEIAHALTQFEEQDHGPMFDIIMLGLMVKHAPKRARRQK